jgi:hypothetical protein
MSGTAHAAVHTSIFVQWLPTEIYRKKPKMRRVAELRVKDFAQRAGLTNGGAYKAVIQ